MNLTESSETQQTTQSQSQPLQVVQQTTQQPKSQSIVDKIENAAVNRWKIETLTGLLGMKSLQAHQAETQRNVAAENRHVRKSLWGETTEQCDGDDMAGSQTILGDNINPTPVVIAGAPQQQQSTLAPLLAGAAIAASAIGIPGAGIAGYLLNKALTDKPATAQPQQFPDTETVDLGLLRFDDLKQ